MDKVEIVRLIEAGYARLESELAQLSDAQITSVPIHDDWTVKDILAHLAYWEGELLGWLNQAANGQKPDVPNFTDEQLNQVNGNAILESRQYSLADLRASYRQVHKQLITVLRDLPYDPQDARWAVWQRPNGVTPWQIIADNTYEHYAEHLKPIQALIDPPTGM